MDGKYWKQFESSGKIQDYLNFVAVRDTESGIRQSADAFECRGNAVEERGGMANIHCGATEDAGKTGQSCRNIFM